MSIEVRTSKYITCSFSLGYKDEIELEVDDAGCEVVITTVFTPEQWDQVVEAMAKARKEQA